jgi:hypothetical protein
MSFSCQICMNYFEQFPFHDAMEDLCVDELGDEGDESQTSAPVSTLVSGEGEDGVGRNPVEVHVEPDSPEEPRVLGEENETVGEGPEAAHPPVESERMILADTPIFAPCPASLADSAEPCASDFPGEGPSGPDPRVLDSARPLRRLAVVELHSDSDGEMPSSFLSN